MTDINFNQMEKRADLCAEKNEDGSFCEEILLEEITPISVNEAAKLQIAEELLLQGVSQNAVSRILNI